MPKQKNKKVSVARLTRSARVQPKTLDKKNRTVEVVFTRGAQVKRYDWFNDKTFLEELSLEEGHVRMGRLNNRAPFLDSHGFGEKRGVRNQLGVVESAKLISNKEGRALIRFSKRDEVEDIFNDVEDGILSNVSVGYDTHKIQKTEEDGELPVYRAVDWEPVEISLVVAGADPEAQVRSDDCPRHECEIIGEFEDDAGQIDDTRENKLNKDKELENKELENSEEIRETKSITRGEDTMPEKIKDEIKKDAEKIENEKKELEIKARNAGAEQERIRAKEIRSLVGKVSLDSELADKYIEENKTLEDVRSLVIDEIAKRDSAPEAQTTAVNHEVTVGEDNARKHRVEGMTNAILNRFRPNDEVVQEGVRKVEYKGFELNDHGKDFRFLSLFDMATRCLTGVNVDAYPKHRLVDMALQRRGLHSTSDFPEILANVINKSLRAGYQAAPVTWKPFVRETSVTDFKEISRVNLGGAPGLDKVGENGEVKRGTISEAAEKYSIDEYAKIVGITRKVIVNDDLDAMTRLPERMGRKAADLESDLVYALIKANANMADGNALYSSAHSNLSAAPGIPSDTTLNLMRLAFRKQVGLDSEEIILVPVFLIVPPTQETATEKLLATNTPAQVSQVNPYGPQGRTPLSFDVEPRLETGTGASTTAWFAFAGKGAIDMIELARLAGTNGPQTETKEGFDVKGLEIMVSHDVGVKAIDWRGMYKDAGA